MQFIAWNQFSLWNLFPFVQTGLHLQPTREDVLHPETIILWSWWESPQLIIIHHSFIQKLILIPCRMQHHNITNPIVLRNNFRCRFLMEILVVIMNWILCFCPCVVVFSCLVIYFRNHFGFTSWLIHILVNHNYYHSPKSYLTENNKNRQCFWSYYSIDIWHIIWYN